MRRSKYAAVPTVVDGVRFASKREAQRYFELKMRLLAREITDLELQPKFPVEVRGKKVCTYIADFQYRENGVLVVEDVKSPATKTPVYRLKKKLCEALYGIVVREVF